MARTVLAILEDTAMWRDTAWSWVFIVLVVAFGLAFGG